MKTNTFLWGWQEYAPIVDKSMTRERLVKLMRAWRRSTTQGRRNFEFKLISRNAEKRIYRVSTVGYYCNEDVATVHVINTKRCEHENVGVF